MAGNMENIENNSKQQENVKMSRKSSQDLDHTIQDDMWDLP